MEPGSSLSLRSGRRARADARRRRRARRLSGRRASRHRQAFSEAGLSDPHRDFRRRREHHPPRRARGQPDAGRRRFDRALDRALAGAGVRRAIGSTSPQDLRLGRATDVRRHRRQPRADARHGGHGTAAPLPQRRARMRAGWRAAGDRAEHRRRKAEGGRALGNQLHHGPVGDLD